MRKVVAYELLSLDGVAEQPDEFVTASMTSCGRTSAASSPPRTLCCSDAAPTTTRPISGRQCHRAIRKLHQRRPKVRGDIHASRAGLAGDRSWRTGGRLRHRVKQQPGGDIGIHGSISLTQSLLEASLVDELRLVIAPAVTCMDGDSSIGGVPGGCH